MEQKYIYGEWNPATQERDRHECDDIEQAARDLAYSVAPFLGGGVTIKMGGKVDADEELGGLWRCRVSVGDPGQRLSEYRFSAWLKHTDETVLTDAEVDAATREFIRALSNVV